MADLTWSRPPVVFCRPHCRALALALVWLCVGGYAGAGLQPVDWEAPGPGPAGLQTSSLSLSPDRESHDTWCSPLTAGQHWAWGDNLRESCLTVISVSVSQQASQRMTEEPPGIFFIGNVLTNFSLRILPFPLPCKCNISTLEAEG